MLGGYNAVPHSYDPIDALDFIINDPPMQTGDYCAVGRDETVAGNYDPRDQADMRRRRCCAGAISLRATKSPACQTGPPILIIRLPDTGNITEHIPQSKITVQQHSITFGPNASFNYELLGTLHGDGMHFNAVVRRDVVNDQPTWHFIDGMRNGGVSQASPNWPAGNRRPAFIAIYRKC